MAFAAKTAATEKAFGVTAQRAFLLHLAKTANVTASAKTAGVSTSPVYALREKSPDFRSQWLAALCEGYARLEADLLAEALRPAGSTIKDSTLKQRQMKVRLGTILLAAHRASVRGDLAPTPKRSRDPKEVQQRLESRFAAMRKGLSDDSRTAE